MLRLKCTFHVKCNSLLIYTSFGILAIVLVSQIELNVKNSGLLQQANSRDLNSARPTVG